jgi:hypothetical protein
MRNSFLPLALTLVIVLPACRTSGERPPSALPKIRVAADGRTFVTEKGKPFVPMGVNYYRPGTGWAPQVWRKWDPEATRADFARMQELGINCVRVFLTYGSFYQKPGVLEPEGLARFDQLLSIAEQAGIYVHPTGPDHWEGMPSWQPVAIEDEPTLDALEQFWRLFAARYRGRNVIFAYDLRNEPEVAWDSKTLNGKWNAYLDTKYGSSEALRRAWNKPVVPESSRVPAPSDQSAPRSRELLDYQDFREGIADAWTQRQAAAIKSADPEALVTVGLIQWSVPALLPGLKHYSAFRPARQARYLDFMEVHFYPLARGAYEYRNEADETANLAYLESVVREVAACGKPVVLAEFGWYGGGKPKFDRGSHPASTEEQHARYCRRAVEVALGHVTGWLNWGLYDQPEATDCSELTGLLTAEGKLKAWGAAFRDLAGRYRNTRIPAAKPGFRPVLDWDACLTSSESARGFREDYLRAFQAENPTLPTPVSGGLDRP